MTDAKDVSVTIDDTVYTRKNGVWTATTIWHNEADMLDHIETLTRERDAAVQDATRQLDFRFDANRELVALQREFDALREAVQSAVPHILANIHHVSGCIHFTPQKVCNCGTRPAYEALTQLADAARFIRTADAKGGEE
jgi:hypothetical protein